MSRRQRLFFKAGCWAALVMAAVHMIGHLSGPQPPANDTERQLLQLYESYRFALPGGSRTLAEFMSGFSLVFSLSLAMFGGTNLLVVRRCPDDQPLMRLLTILALAFCVTVLVISLTHFFLIPTLCIAAVTLCFAAAL